MKKAISLIMSAITLISQTSLAQVNSPTASETESQKMERICSGLPQSESEVNLLLKSCDSTSLNRLLIRVQNLEQEVARESTKLRDIKARALNDRVRANDSAYTAVGLGITGGITSVLAASLIYDGFSRTNPSEVASLQAGYLVAGVTVFIIAGAIISYLAYEKRHNPIAVLSWQEFLELKTKVDALHAELPKMKKLLEYSIQSKSIHDLLTPDLRLE